MDLNAAVLFVAFVFWSWFHDRKDQRIWSERQAREEEKSHELQANSQKFHQDTAEQNRLIYGAMGKALEKYAEAMEKQGARHAEDNALHRANFQIETLQGEIEELKQKLNKIDAPRIQT